MTNLFVLCGPPATGKGYFSELMEELLHKEGFGQEDIDLISVGEILREERENGNEDVDKVSVDDETDFSCQVVMSIFKKRLDPEAKITILDGIPRTLKQLEYFQDLTQNYTVYVIFLNGNEDVLMQKMLKRANEEHRQDDNIENFKKRIEIYKKYTLPTIVKMEEAYKENFIEVSTNEDMTLNRVGEVLKKVTLS